jgi:hypothetical protein
VAIGQVGEASPVPLLGQHLQQQIEGVRGCQQDQQMQTPELGRTEGMSPTAASARRKDVVDEIVGNIRREFLEESGRTSRRKQGIHGAENYPQKQPLSAKKVHRSFFGHKHLL